MFDKQVLIQWVHIVNDRLDGSLAGTLAGLSLTAAAIAFAMREAIADDINIIESKKGLVRSETRKLHDDLTKITRRLIESVYCFMIFLILEIAGGDSAGVNERAGVVPVLISLPEGLTFVSTAGAGGLGLLSLISALRVMKRRII